MAHEELLSDQHFQQATNEQIFALVDKLDAEIQRRGMVFLQVGIGKHFWINIVLTILGFVPGIIHAVWVIAKY